MRALYRSTAPIPDAVVYNDLAVLEILDKAALDRHAAGKLDGAKHSVLPVSSVLARTWADVELIPLRLIYYRAINVSTPYG